MASFCPICSTQLMAGSRFCHKCGAPPESVGPSVVQRVAVLFARLLILFTLVVNIAGWVGCLKRVDVGVMVGLLNGVLGLLLLIVGLIGRYRWAWGLGLAHFALPLFVFAMVAHSHMGPLRARPMFLWVDAVFLAIVIPVSIIGCYRGAPSRAFKQPGLCSNCGYPRHGLTEPRCPECGTPFEPKLPAGSNQSDAV